ncbi:MAG: hypothetical protein JNL70_15830 [Saprospiraceae bacterium]|nr:hypothetical protein [Saprospiraceae bacterium]
MKRFNRHGLIALIASSLLLLGVFEVFWIKKLYDEQLLSLKKDLDHTFRTTVMALQDSIIQLNFDGLPKPQWANSKQLLPPQYERHNRLDIFTPRPNNDNFRQFEMHENRSFGDSLQQSKITFIQKGGVRITIAADSLSGRELARIVTRAYMGKASDSLKAIGILNYRSDSVKTRIDFTQKDTILTSTKSNSRFSIDSTKGKSMSTRFVLNKTLSPKDSAIFIKLNYDSIRLDDIAAHFWLALAAQKMDLPFRIHRLHQNQIAAFSSNKRETISEQYEGLTTNPVFAGIPKFNVYLAQFPQYQAFLFRKIVPQVLFSLLLFGMTTLAFALIYRSLRQQERLTALKNDFISNITHELKTPIATVSVAIEALQSFNALQKPELTKEYLDISKNELSRLSMLVDKVLKLSVFEQKEPELKKESLDLATLIAQVLDSMRLQFEKMGAKITFDTEGSENTVIEADRVHLTSVVYNLLDNALKYNGKNISINLKEYENTLHLVIEDDGCGIAAEYQDKIFDKFFRVPTGDVHNVKGYGLGLSYVASVVQQHGGKIGVKSIVEKGSTFSVILPKEL